VQGLGYVGTAMLAALSQAKDDDNECSYNVIGIDLGDENNYWKIGRVNEGKSPSISTVFLPNRAAVRAKLIAIVDLPS